MAGFGFGGTLTEAPIGKKKKGGGGPTVTVTAPQEEAPPSSSPSSPAPPSGPGSNPYYDQLVSLYRAQGAAEAAAMRSAIQQMLIGFGLVPEGFKDKFGSLDATTKALIQKNTDTGISTYARLLEAKREGIRSLINRLNARGLRRSGARGYGLRKNQLQADRALADSLSALMRDIGGMYSTYTSNEYARQAALIQAAMQYMLGSWNAGSGSPSSPSTDNTGTTRTASAGRFGPGQTDEAFYMGGGWWAM